MLLIENIGCLVTLNTKQEQDLGEITDAAVLIDGENINWCGKQAELPKVSINYRLNAHGKLVVPGLIDCHTHLIFAGSRADEFARRMNNESYQTIIEKGGGIRSTVMATRLASDEELLMLAKERADKILISGVTTLEAKSGYGLTADQELRTLRLLKKLDENHPLDIHKTFLGAHIIPDEFKDTRHRYISYVINDMLSQVASLNLAQDCDVFCESHAFSVDESKEILSAAFKLGFGLRAHVQQLSYSKGVNLLKELPIKSLSHADFLTEEDIELIAQSNTVIETLPIAALFLRSKQITPVIKLLNASVPLAIATDFNPGSAMCNDLVLAARLGATYSSFPLNEAMRAITINAARSLGRTNIGKIATGCQGDLLITNCETINEFFYDWTKHPTETVIKRGVIYKMK